MSTEVITHENVLNIAFIGCVTFSARLLECLLSLQSERIRITCIVTKSQSHINDDHVDLLPLAQKFNIPALDYANLPDSIEAFLLAHEPDVIYCFGWSHLIPEPVINIAKYGAIGFHPTKLPLHRGRHPIIWTLALGLEETATTFFQMEEGADTGAILHQQCLSVDIKDNASTLYEKIILQALEQAPLFSRQLRDRTAVFTPQDEAKSSVWRKRGFKDGLIDWRMSAQAIYNLIRALTKPYCGAQFAYKEQYITVWEAKLEPNEVVDKNFAVEPGLVLSIDKNHILIQCGDATRLLVSKTDDFPALAVGDYL